MRHVLVLIAVVVGGLLGRLFHPVLGIMVGGGMLLGRYRFRSSLAVSIVGGLIGGLIGYTVYWVLRHGH